MKLVKYTPQPAVEMLTFSVAPEMAQRFVEVDHRIWTEMLGKYDDQLEKEVWMDQEDKGRITTILYWSSLERWKSVPADELAKTQERFEREFGGEYRMIGEGHKSCQMFRSYGSKKEK